MKKLKSIFNFIEDPEGLFLSFFNVNSNHEFHRRYEKFHREVFTDHSSLNIYHHWSSNLFGLGQYFSSLTSSNLEYILKMCCGAKDKEELRKVETIKCNGGFHGTLWLIIQLGVTHLWHWRFHLVQRNFKVRLSLPLI